MVKIMKADWDLLAEPERINAEMRGEEVEWLEEVELVNRTPHPITIMDENKNVLANIEPQGEPIRLDEKLVGCEKIVDKKTGVEILLCDKKLEPSGLPKREKDKMFIVSLPVAQAVKRDDFIAPDGYIRDENGRIIGVKSFKRVIR